MKITTTLTKKYIYHFKGVDKHFHEIQDKIVDNVKGILECEVDSDIDIKDDGCVINVITPVEIPFMSLSAITNAIPVWYDECEEKENQELEKDRKFYLNWISKIVVPEYKDFKETHQPFVRNIRAKFADAVNYAKNQEWDMAVVCAADFDDLLSILKKVERNEMKQAYKDYRSLDTAVREYVPSEVVNKLCPK